MKRNMQTDEAKRRADWERYRARWPLMKVKGQEFHQVPWTEARALFGNLLDATDDDETVPNVMLPVRDLSSFKDDYRDFPARPDVNDLGFTVSSGIAAYDVEDRVPDGCAIFPRQQAGRWLLEVGNVTLNTKRMPLAGPTATQLRIFVEADWYGACWQVLEAHGWRETSETFLTEVERAEPGTVEAAKTLYGDNWSSYVFEIAAKHLCPPLSRLWYAANMMSLYYVHNDDIRLGYLWCEYKNKLKYEEHVLARISQIEKNRESGVLGGQADQARKRSAVLDQLARADGRFENASDRARLNYARELATKYDQEHPSLPLFMRGGEQLSDEWFKAWLGNYIASRTEEAVKKGRTDE